MDEPSLVDLLERARGADPRCLERLFGECRNLLVLTARAQLESWLKTKIDASDVVQETLLEAYRDFANFRGNSEAEWVAWLRQILAHNLANFVRQYRTGKRQIHRETVQYIGPESTGDRLAQLPDSSETPSSHLLRKERELLVADALTRLSDDHREVILLRNLQRLPFDEVATRMERSRPAVQMLWMRALEKLRQVLAEMNVT